MQGYIFMFSSLYINNIVKAFSYSNDCKNVFTLNICKVNYTFLNPIPCVSV